MEFWSVSNSQKGISQHLTLGVFMNIVKRYRANSQNKDIYIFK